MSSYTRLCLLASIALLLPACGSSTATSTDTNTATIPATPTTLIIQVVGAAQITVSWEAVNTATHYALYRGLAANGDNRSLISSNTATSYPDSGLTNNTLYYYWLQACNSAGCSAFSAAINGQTQSTPVVPTNAPTTPTALMIQVDSAAQITVSWQMIDTATYYALYRGLAANGDNRSLISSNTATSYPDSGLTNNTLYYYWLQACNSAGCSAFSEAINGQTQSTPVVPTNAPTTPTALMIQVDSAAQITVSWEAVNTAAYYKLYRGLAANGSGRVHISSDTTTRYTDSGLADNTRYYYWLQACNSAGCSAFSASSDGTRTAVGDYRLRSVDVTFYDNTTTYTNTYDYDAHGNMTQWVIYSGGSAPSSLTVTTNVVVARTTGSYTYDNDNNIKTAVIKQQRDITSATWAVTITTYTYTYDFANKSAVGVEENSGNVNNTTHIVTFNDQHQPSNVLAQSLTNATKTFTYDSQERQVLAQNIRHSTTETVSLGYSNDRIYQKISSTKGAYLLDSTATYTYNNFGNITQQQTKTRNVNNLSSASPSISTYTSTIQWYYDDGERLTSGTSTADQTIYTHWISATYDDGACLIKDQLHYALRSEQRLANYSPFRKFYCSR